MLIEIKIKKSKKFYFHDGTDLDTVGPVCVHGPVLVMETLELELQVWPPHQGLLNLRLEVKDVV